jgi:gamma-glutamylcyclotransferase (GGCT)/AIG2-like uncharacterized protein YtfP
MKKRDQLFVYGSLRSGFRHPAFKYISNHFAFVAMGIAKGVLYDMGSYPAAKSTNDEFFVRGELYVIKAEHEFDWAIAQLDDYEGVDEEENRPSLYTRVVTEVRLDNGKRTTAWIYWFNGDVSGKSVIQSGDSLQYFQSKTQH